MIERILENVMYSSRWLLAPIYLGLSVALLFLGVKFFGELIHVAPNILDISESNLVLVVLSLIDMALVGGLIVMVMFSGYENFVSKLDVEVSDDDKPSWMGTMDANSLKNKVAASIVAISSIHLLRIFMSIQPDDTSASNERLLVYVVIHMTFVASAFAMGYLDKISKK